jgi:hypothetical protein
MKYLGLILFVTIVLSSCKKDNTGGCISRIEGPVQVSAADMASIQALLSSNHLTANSQVFVIFRTYLGVDPQSSYKYAEATEVRNGLPIFYGDIVYDFRNDIVEDVNGKMYGAISLDNKSSRPVSGLRQLFLNAAINKQGLNKSFNDSCYVAQLGYFNTHLFSNDTTTNFVKAWQVRPLHSLYPQCYINDNDGSTLYFDSGIRLD